jgi:hypothetical protein
VLSLLVIGVVLSFINIRKVDFNNTNESREIINEKINGIIE